MILFENNCASIKWEDDSFYTYSQLRVTFKCTHIENESYKELLTNYVQLMYVITKKYYLVFDVKSLKVEPGKPNKELLAHVKLFSDIHIQLREHYDKHLLCSQLLIANKNVKMFVNSIIGMFIKPYRPFRISCHENEGAKFLITCMKIEKDIYANNMVGHKGFYED